MATKKKNPGPKFVPTYTVELLESQKAVAHKRLTDGGPSILQHSRKKFLETGELVTIEGFTFLYTSMKEFNGSMPEGLERFASWYSRCKPAQFSGDPIGCSPGACVVWLGLPDGTWTAVAGTWSREITVCCDGDLDFIPVKRVDARWITTNAQTLYMPARAKEIIDEFSETWKLTRTQYRKTLKKTGKIAEELAREESAREVRRTQTRMDVLLHVDDLIQELETYKAQLSGDNMDFLTQERVRKIFDMTNELTSVNKKLKDAHQVK